TIELVTNASESKLNAYDVVIRPGRRPAHTPHGADMRIAIVAPSGENLKDQKLNLLQVLDDAQRQGLDLANVALDSDSDPRVTAGLPRAANDLRQLLEQKGLIR